MATDKPVLVPAEVERLTHSLLSLDRLAVQTALHESLGAHGTLPTLDRLFIPALAAIGDAWERGDVSLSQVYMSSRICEDLFAETLPVRSASRSFQPRLGIAVLADFHMLGKRIVNAVLAAGGFRIIDYGHVEQGSRLAALALKDRLDILLISTLMLRAALEVKEVCRQRDLLNGSFKIIVGGAPYLLDPALWQEVGADAMAHSAADVIPLIHSMSREVAI